MVYEANARIRDPVYGCAGAIFQLQKQVNELQAQLAKARAEIVNMQCQQTNLLILCMEMAQKSPPKSATLSKSLSPDHPDCMEDTTPSNNGCFTDDNNLGLPWEALWT